MKTSLVPALLLGALLLATAPASAQTAPAAAAPPTTAARQQARAYVRQTVLPAVREQRRQLDAQLSPADRRQLALYRGQLREIRGRGRALRQSWRPATGVAATPGTRPPLTEAQRQQMQQLRTDTRRVMASVGQLAQQYAPAITRLTAALEPRQAQWATDLRAITGRANEPAETAAPASRSRRRAGPAGRLLRPVAFLLLDPTAPIPAPANEARPATSLVYPNPASTTTQLAYEVAKAGAVTVELLDSRGNILRTVSQESKPAIGPHTLAVEVADLPAGTYFFKIKTRSGTETRRFVKQ